MKHRKYTTELIGVNDMQEIKMVIEKSQGRLWGHVVYQGTTLTDIDKTVEGLERRLKSQLNRFFQLRSDAILLKRHYDLTALFVRFQSLKLIVIARLSGIESSQLQQYAAGVAYPTEEEAERLEKVIQELGRELTSTFIYSKKKDS